MVKAAQKAISWPNTKGLHQPPLGLYMEEFLLIFDNSLPINFRLLFRVSHSVILVPLQLITLVWVFLWVSIAMEQNIRVRVWLWNWHVKWREVCWKVVECCNILSCGMNIFELAYRFGCWIANIGFERSVVVIVYSVRYLDKSYFANVVSFIILVHSTASHFCSLYMVPTQTKKRKRKKETDTT